MSISSFTTLGTTLAATCSTDPVAGPTPDGLAAGAGTAGLLGAVLRALARPLAAERSGWLVSATAPTPAVTTATAAAPVITIPARERLRAFGEPTGNVTVGVWSGKCAWAWA
jgi:hypothetical protein